MFKYILVSTKPLLFESPFTHLVCLVLRGYELKDEEIKLST